MDTQPLTIYTIGHSNLNADAFVDLLSAHGIAILVDVRSAPYSRYVPDYNRERIQARLRAAGIDYHFAGKFLGGRPNDPGCYKAGSPREVDYQVVMAKDWYQRGIGRLLEIAAGAPTAIMCSEEDPARCHRHHLIAQTLVAMGVEVLHIRHKKDAPEKALLAGQEPPPAQLSFDLPPGSP